MAGARTPLAPRVGPRSVLTDHLLARHRRMKRRASVGLALAGGGPLGGIYEVGALIALSDSLDGIDLTTSMSMSVSQRAASWRPRWRTASPPLQCTRRFSAAAGVRRCCPRLFFG